ncbi:unnamed protein product, partial [Sphagnum tenellum]
GDGRGQQGQRAVREDPGRERGGGGGVRGGGEGRAGGAVQEEREAADRQPGGLQDQGCGGRLSSAEPGGGRHLGAARQRQPVHGRRGGGAGGAGGGGGDGVGADHGGIGGGIGGSVGGGGIGGGGGGKTRRDGNAAQGHGQLRSWTQDAGRVRAVNDGQMMLLYNTRVWCCGGAREGAASSIGQERREEVCRRNEGHFRREYG